MMKMAKDLQTNNSSPSSELPPLSASDLALLRRFVEEQGLPSQVEAITCEAPLTVVSAGAGTGKTWTLAWRFVWTALTRQDVRRILTLTFTEKAASEMRSRIASLLISLEKPLSPSAELSRRRAAALMQLDQAYISTMHGFSMRVISEAGLSLGAEPSSRVIANPEADEFWSEAAGALDRLDAAWFSRSMNSAFKEEARKLLSDNGVVDIVNQWGPARIAGFARDFAETMSDFGETPETTLQKGSEPDSRALSLLKKIMEDRSLKLAARWTSALNLDAAAYGKPGKLAEQYENLRRSWSNVDLTMPEKALAFVPAAAEAVKGARGKLADALAQRLGMKLKDWRDAALSCEDFIRLTAHGWSADETRLRFLLVALARLCWKKWNAFKETRGALSFGDMILLAKEALDADRGYASRFKEVLVDEFQDTNDQQDGLLRTVRRAASPLLFIVGDLKQSIYRFRHAEPALFERYIAEAHGAGGRYISLSVSFRSGEKILRAVNGRFEPLWKDRLGEGLNVPYEPLQSPRGLDRAASWIDKRQQTGVPVCETLYESPAVDGEGKATELMEDVRGRLAERLAVRLSELREGSATVWDGKDLRPLRWSDMAVLTPARTSYEGLRRAFSKMAVPAVFMDSRGFYARPEIRDVCALAAFLADPRDRSALAGFLCSPFSGLTQRQAQDILPRLSSDDPLGSLREIHDVGEAKRCGLAQRLEFLARRALLQGPSPALASLLKRGDLLKNIHPAKRASVLANLRRAVTLLDEYSHSVGPSPLGAASYLQRALKQGTADPEASAESDADALHVMTVHASKGLEFPLVVLYGLEHGSSRTGRPQPLAPSRALIAAASSFPDSWEPQNPCLLGKVDALLEEQAEYEERQRLYYVALTRARDGLILCGIVPRRYDAERDRSFLSIESQTQMPAPDGQIVDPEKAQKLRQFNVTGVPSGEKRGEDVPVMVARVRALREISASSWARWNLCPAAWRMLYRQRLNAGWNSDSDAGDLSAGGVNFGMVAHWVLSVWNFTDGDYRRILALPDGSLKPEFRSAWRDEAVKKELEFFLQKFHTVEGEELLRRLKEAMNAGTLEREAPFRAPLGAVDLTGVVDAFWIEKDSTGAPVRLCVRDYKTTRMTGRSARWTQSYYARQLNFYALALKLQNPGYRSLEADLALWSLRSGRELRVPPLTPEEEELMKKKLLEQAERAVTGPWPPAEDCGGCPLLKSCVFRRTDESAAAADL